MLKQMFPAKPSRKKTAYSSRVSPLALENIARKKLTSLSFDRENHRRADIMLLEELFSVTRRCNPRLCRTLHTSTTHIHKHSFTFHQPLSFC